MALQTAASKYVEALLAARWPLEFGGKTGPCRYINGGSCGHPNEPGSSYSQHSWGNALDVYPIGHKGMTKEMIQGRLTPVWEFIKSHRMELGIRVDLNWDDNDAHWNHIHIDFYPTGKFTPSCCPGTTLNTWQKRSGHTYTLPGAISPVMEAEGEISDPNKLPLSHGDRSQLVTDHQNAMMAWDPLALPKWGADGDFGDETEDWVKIFELRWGMAPTGVIDQILSDLLMGTPVVVPTPPLPPTQPPSPPIIIMPPSPVPEQKPLPEYDAGFEGSYRKFFYPLKGGVEAPAVRENQSALEDFLNKRDEWAQNQINDIVGYLETIGGETRLLMHQGGVSGAPGHTGARGPRGLTGERGPHGPMGQTGRTGTTGPKGDDGDPGPIGHDGPPGHVGAIGPEGQRGLRGDGLAFLGAVATAAALPPIGGEGGMPGDAHLVVENGNLYTPHDGKWISIGHMQGPQGQRGAPGPIGHQGAPGAGGIDGHRGAPGLKGDTGGKGEKGDKGNPGIHGTHGDSGGPGPEGPVGPPGHSIHIMSTVPDAAHLPDIHRDGDAHFVLSTGDLMIWSDHDNAWMDMGHVAGPKGDRGVIGPEGPSGVHGLHGDVGDQGPKGDKGDKGDTGDAGPQGQIGEQGHVGDAGPIGHEGTHGLAGPAGHQGAQGERGPLGHSIHILSVVATPADLPADQTADHDGDAHLVRSTGDLMIWSDHDHSWHDMGHVQGPPGDRGLEGPVGPASTVEGPRGPIGDTGPNGHDGQPGPMGHISDAHGDLRYLMLDASNDPVSGPLHIDDTVHAHEFIETQAIGAAHPHNHDDRYLAKTATIAGPQGPQGDRGAPGARGHKGDPGTAGARGPAGAASRVPGPRGATGGRGGTGPRGATGSISNAAGDARYCLKTNGTVNGTLHVHRTLSFTGNAGEEGIISYNGFAFFLARKLKETSDYHHEYLKVNRMPLVPRGSGDQYLGISTARWSTIYSSHALNTSDPSLKKHITKAADHEDHPEGILSKVKKIHPIRFKWHKASDPYHAEHHPDHHQMDHHGFNALHLDEHFPNLGLAVNLPDVDEENGPAPWFVDPLEITATLWAALVELAEQVDALEARV